MLVILAESFESFKFIHLEVEQQKLTGFSLCVNFMHTSFCLLFMHLVDSFHDQRRVLLMRTLASLS